MLPVFRGSLQPDITFFGFDVSADAGAPATDGDPGWYVVIQEQPTEPRFGLDVGDRRPAPRSASCRSAPAAAGAADSTALTWGRNAAHMAGITPPLPVRIAIHASRLRRSDLTPDATEPTRTAIVCFDHRAPAIADAPAAARC